MAVFGWRLMKILNIGYITSLKELPVFWRIFILHLRGERECRRSPDTPSS